METLPITGTCTHHPDRQASFRCTSCGLFFCSECASLHNNRLICTACLQREERLHPGKKRTRRLAQCLGWVWPVVSVFVLWMSLFLAGRILVEIPTNVHDGLIWKDLYE